MPKNFPSSFFYSIYYDESLPKEIKEKKTIILTSRGLAEIAQHYNLKYQINISTHSYQVKVLQDKIQTLIKSDLTHSNYGFLLIDHQASSHGHALPMILEKNNGQISLFFLDVGYSFYRRSNWDKRETDFINSLRTSFPSLELWSLQYCRQVDHSSCMTDALVILKDGLRLFPSFREIASAKFIEERDGFQLFHLPEELLKTAQIGSLIAESHADGNKIIKTKQHPTTLSTFRKQYEIETYIFDHKIREQKKVQLSTYTLFKSKKFVPILKDRWQKAQDLEMIELINMLFESACDFAAKNQYTKEASDTAGNRFFDSMREEIGYDPAKKLENMLDYLSLAQNREHYQFKLFDELCKKAKRIFDMLVILFADKEEPNLMGNLEKFLSYYSKCGLRAEQHVINLANALKYAVIAREPTLTVKRVG